MAQPGEVIFEFVRFGATLKVVAVDADTGFEVSIIVPAATSQPDAQRLAAQKLRRKLGHQPPDTPAKPPSGGGIIV
jgi:hypothetical protein